MLEHKELLMRIVCVYECCYVKELDITSQTWRNVSNVKHVRNCKINLKIAQNSFDPLNYLHMVLTLNCSEIHSRCSKT